MEYIGSHFSQGGGLHCHILQGPLGKMAVGYPGRKAKEVAMGEEEIAGKGIRGSWKSHIKVLAWENMETLSSYDLQYVFSIAEG